MTSCCISISWCVMMSKQISIIHTVHSAYVLINDLLIVLFPLNHSIRRYVVLYALLRWCLFIFFHSALFSFLLLCRCSSLTNKVFFEDRARRHLRLPLFFYHSLSLSCSVFTSSNAASFLMMFISVFFLTFR
ncbi:MAG: hypothetical protein J3R72DRAFT_459199 [Linnemannia gamsii]|nr:MAG: hypothetical protein J3R72DRAFT_459199 [Linnemannia gamsii]